MSGGATVAAEAGNLQAVARRGEAVGLGDALEPRVELAFLEVTTHLDRGGPNMELVDSVRKNGPFIAVFVAILLTGAALTIATLSLLFRM